MKRMNDRNSNLRKRILCAGGAFCALFLAFALCSESFAAQPRHIIIIGWDGCQREQLNGLLVRNELPNLRELAKEGSMVDIKVTGGAPGAQAGWSQLLTGYEPEKSGVWSNGRYQAIPAGYTLFERAEQALGPGNVATAMIATQSIPGEPYANAKKGIDLFRNDLPTNAEVAKLALQTIEANKNRQMVLFIHLANPDLEGRRNSGSSNGNEAGIKQNDAWTGVILRNLRGLGIYKDSLIYITADHGLNEGQDAPKNAASVFLATNDKQVRRGGAVVDVAPTVLVRLGIDVNAIVPKLDGMPLNQGHNPVKAAALR